MLSRPIPHLPFDRVGAAQLHWDRTTEEITGGAPLAQVFHCAQDALHRIEVFIEATYQHKRCHLWLKLFAGDVGGVAPAQRPPPLCLIGPLAADALRGHGWLGFEFESIPASAGKFFTAEFFSPDAARGNGLTLRMSAGTGEGLFVQARPRPGALLFRALCLQAPGPAENFARFRATTRTRPLAVDHQPLMARLEISRPCNLHCVMCLRGLNPYDAKNEPVAFLSLETFRLLDPVLPGLLWAIAFGLGEPFLNPHYLAILRHLRSRNPFVHVVTSTNGTCLRDETIAAVVDENLISDLQVSIDGARAETFEGVRHGASYATVRGTLGRILAARERRHPRQLTVRGAMLVMKPTAGEVYEFIRQMADMGADYAVLDSPKGSQFAALRSDSPDEMRAIHEQVLRGQEALAGSATTLAGPLLEELRTWHQKSGRTDALASWTFDPAAQIVSAAAPRASACGVPWESFSLTTDGAMRVCCNSQRFMGTPRTSDCATVWQQGDNYAALRNELVAAQPDAECRACLTENFVPPAIVTSPTYLGGCIERGLESTLRAGLLHRRIDLSALDAADDASLTIDELDWRTAADSKCGAGAPWPACGWLTSAKGFDLRADLPQLAFCVDSVVRGFATANVVSAHFAQWSVWFDDIPRPASPDGLIALRVISDGSQLCLRRLPRQATAAAIARPVSSVVEHAPWLDPFEIVPNPSDDAPLAGVIDEVYFEAGHLHLVGWARDMETATPASRVIAFVQGRPVRSVRPDRNRPDVTKAFGGTSGRYGFGLDIPLAGVRTTIPKRITLVAANDRGSAVRLRWGLADGCLRRAPADALGSHDGHDELLVQNQEAWLRESVLPEAADRPPLTRSLGALISAR